MTCTSKPWLPGSPRGSVVIIAERPSAATENAAGDANADPGFPVGEVNEFPVYIAVHPEYGPIEAT